MKIETPTDVFGRGIIVGLLVSMNIRGYNQDALGLDNYVQWVQDNWVHMSPFWHATGLVLVIMYGAWYYGKMKVMEGK